MQEGVHPEQVVLAIALGVGRHAMAHGHHHHLSSGGTAGHAVAPGATVPVNEREDGRVAERVRCWVGALHDLMVLCHENGWRL